MEERVSLRVLGVFMASFVYSIVSPYSLDKTGGGYMLPSPFTVFVLAIARAGVFELFIHHVARSVQIGYMIDGIYAVSAVRWRMLRLISKR
ncbi:MAG: DUF2254 family protein [Bacillota bacterium]